jgi:diguanylate cyclase (GGDEF)-like protein/PAS domain S-box-containing protein
MLRVSLDGQVLRVNDATCALLGRPRADLQATDVSSWCAANADRVALDRLLAAATSGTSAGQSRLVLTAVTARAVGVLASWTLAGDPPADPPCLHVVLTVESGSLQAERVLAASVARWRALLVNAADLTWTADRAGVLLSVTSATSPQYGWQLTQLLGRGVFEFVHRQDLPAFRAAWHRVADGAAHVEAVDCRIRRADGSWTWVRQTLTDLLLDPNVRSVVGNVVDTGDARRRDHERTQLQRRFRARFDTSRVPQAMLESDGSLSSANAAFCELVGQPWEAMAGSDLREVFLAEPLPGDDVDVASVLTGARETLEVQGAVAGASGPVPVVLDLTLVRDAFGLPAGAAAYLHDLTTLRDSVHKREQQADFFAALNELAGEVQLVGDPDGTLVYVSPGVTRVFGYTVADVLSAKAWSFVHLDDLQAARAAYLDVAAEGGSRTVLLRLLASDGDWRWAEVTATNMTDTALGGVGCTVRDVTEEVDGGRSARPSDAQYRRLADTAEEGILAVAASGRTLYANSTMASILGLPLRAVYDAPVGDLLQPAEGEPAVPSPDTHGISRYEIGYAHPEGTQRRLWVVTSPLAPIDGDEDGSFALVSDVTAARATEAELRQAALTDPLTGLPNRTLLLDRLDHALRVQTSSTAVVLLDLDRFQLVNQAQGHAVGDNLLIAVAERLTKAAQPGDTVARFGGDEFVVVREDTDDRQALDLAGELLSQLAQPFDLGDEPIHLSASAGIASSPPTSAAELLRYAGAAMHSAKQDGRGRARLFDRALTDDAEQRFAVVADLRLALTHNGLDLHYQPIVDLRSGAVLGMEALARWNHPVRGAIPPAVFVPLAEANGLAALLDRWVLEHAFQEAGALRSAGFTRQGAYLAVNLSAGTLGASGLEDLIVSTTAESHFAPSQVVLEITESAIMHDTEAAISLLERLRERGFQVALDDFGTGYSSLAHLRELPITHLKIDGAFVADIAEDADALAVVASIIDLARAVGITAIAEGVETSQQAALLRALGCPAGQGWQWSSAMSSEQLCLTGAGTRVYDVPADASQALVRRRSPRLPVTGEHGLELLLTLHRQGASISTIAAALNQEGFHAPSGARWHGSSIARVISDHAYPTLSVDLP